MELTRNVQIKSSVTVYMLRLETGGSPVEALLCRGESVLVHTFMVGVYRSPAECVVPTGTT